MAMTPIDVAELRQDKKILELLITYTKNTQ
jgi:hypothetical protein